MFISAPETDYNSYCTVLQADTYHTDRANAVWATTADPFKEAALIRATDYISANYTFSVNPIAETVDQSLVNATAMLALYSLTIDLFPVENSEQVTSSEKSLAGVGTLKSTFSLTKNDRFEFITNMLANIAVYAPIRGSRVTIGWNTK